MYCKKCGNHIEDLIDNNNNTTIDNFTVMYIFACVNLFSQCKGERANSGPIS